MNGSIALRGMVVADYQQLEDDGKTTPSDQTCLLQSGQKTLRAKHSVLGVPYGGERSTLNTQPNSARFHSLAFGESPGRCRGRAMLLLAACFCARSRSQLPYF